MSYFYGKIENIRIVNYNNEKNESQENKNNKLASFKGEADRKIIDSNQNEKNMEQEIHNFSSYYFFIHELYIGSGKNKILIFRGNSISGFNLMPNLFYKQNQNVDEYDECHHIEIEHPNEFDRHNHLSELVKLQHYEAKTRLLDFTRNMLIALFFACQNNLDKDGEVFVLSIDKDEIKHHESDTVLVLSCLPFLKKEDKDKLYKCCLLNKNNKKNNKLNKNLYINEKSVNHLYHEIRSEYPTFDFEINANDLLDVFFVAAKKENERILRQDGLFAIVGLDIINAKNKLNQKIIKKIIIPSRYKKDILKFSD